MANLFDDILHSKNLVVILMHVYSISCTIAIILIVFDHNYLVLLYDGMNDNY